MIRIGKPVIENQGDLVILKALVTNEAECKKDWIWYATSKEYGDFFCPETADSFVVPMILRAVKTHQDILVESEISEKLFYNLNNSVFYALEKAGEFQFGKGHIRIIANKLRSEPFNGACVGTGCSLGVDSFAVIKKYCLEKEVSEGYRITHLSLFNAGAFGGTKNSNIEGVRRSFFEEVKRIEAFANRIELPLVWVDSNVRWFYPESDFNWSHTYLNMGIVLSMQKLWQKYYYASGYSLEHLCFDIKDSAKYEPFLLPHISTESTELISASMDMSRSDKVRYISTDEIVRKNLYVCLKDQISNNALIKNKYEGVYLNCGRCLKCERTLLQLDIFNQLDEFSAIFDLSVWPKRKRYYIGEVIAGKKKNIMMMDLYNSMIDNNYEIPRFSRLYAIYVSSMSFVMKIRRKLKSIKRKLFCSRENQA
jgi:hypothetical protein